MKRTIPTLFLAAALLLAGANVTRGQASTQQAIQDAVAQAKAEAQKAQAEARQAQAEMRQQLDKFQQLQKRFRETEMPLFTERMQGVIRHAPGARQGRALVIRSGDTDPQALVDLQQDLTVMSHILNKTVEEEQDARSTGRTAMGISLMFAPGATSIRSLYLDGYGALFLVRVGLPLLAPSTNSAAHKVKAATDSEWEEARREVYGARPNVRPEPGPALEFNGEKVDRLRDSLLEALTNATNIRGLKPDDSITICVLGGANTSPIEFNRVYTTGSSPSSGAEVRAEVMTLNSGTREVQGRRAAASGTIMTIRARKSNVDAFAKGTLTLEQFRRKTVITTYAADIGGNRGGFPFIGRFGGGGYGGGFGGSGVVLPALKP